MKTISWLALAGLFVRLGAPSRAATIAEDFARNPLQNGWQISGDTNLFQWDSTNKYLRVTWDSSQKNSYFSRPLGTILARDVNFSISFDLRLDDIGPGNDPAKSYTFPLAISFLNLGEARQTNFARGTGYNSPDLAEFAYFFDDGSGYGATDWPTIVSTNSSFNYNSSSDYSTYPLSTGVWYHIAMNYAPSNHTMVTTLSSASTNLTILDPLSSRFTDFRLDTVAVSSYSEAGQAPAYAGSILAHGAVDNFVVTFPPPPVQNLTGRWINPLWQVEFLSQSNWLYSLQRTLNFQSWSNITANTLGNATNLFLQDTSPPSAKAFYRVRAQRP